MKEKPKKPISNKRRAILKGSAAGASAAALDGPGPRQLAAARQKARQRPQEVVGRLR